MIAIFVDFGMLSMELLRQGFVGVSLDAQGLLHRQELEQKGHLGAEGRIELREMRHVVCTEEALWVKLEQFTQLDILVMIVLHPLRVLNDMRQLWLTVDDNLSWPVGMVTNPQLGIVLMVGLLVELCTFWQRGH